MFKIASLIVLATVASLLPVSKVSAEDVTVAPGIQFQEFCHLSGVPKNIPCIVVTKRLSGNEPVASLEMKPEVSVNASSLQTYLVVYAVSIRPGGLNQNSGITVNHKTSMIDADLYGQRPRYFWVSTQDKGRHWSAIHTDHENGTLSN
jgi:hypothetical protein